MPFVKGQSGNPLGRISKARLTFVENLIDSGLAEKALKVLTEEMASNKKNRLTAAQYVLDQAYGKPRQSIEHSGEEGEAIRFSFIVPPQGLFKNDKSN